VHHPRVLLLLFTPPCGCRRLVDPALTQRRQGFVRGLFFGERLLEQLLRVPIPQQAGKGDQAAVARSSSQPSVGDSPYGPTVTIFANDGTPDPLMRKSMYGPGGARLPPAGALALRVVVVPAGRVNVR
jgi:hypothetical protein